MTDPDEPQHRAYHQPDPSRVTVHDLDGDDGTFAVRMPIVSSGEVRNENDGAFTRDELEGMAQQIEERGLSVFLDHGKSELGGSKYSAIGKVGEWTNPEVVGNNDSGEILVKADARLMDPETLPAATGTVREALATVKSQVERDMALSASIGWREDEDAPGGNDLMESSIVGIPADPRTTSDGAAGVVARAAVEAGADPEQLVEEVQAVVMGSDDDTHDMTDEQSESGEEPDDTNEEEDGMDAQEYRETMLEIQQEQMDTLTEVAESIRPKDEEGEDDDEDDEDDEEEQVADTDGEQNTEPDTARTVEIDGEERAVEDVVAEHQDALQTLRENGLTVDDIDSNDDTETDDEQDASDDSLTTDDPNDYWRNTQ